MEQQIVATVVGTQGAVVPQQGHLRRAGDRCSPLSKEQHSSQIGWYPASLIDIWHVKNGARLTLRPVLPQDSVLLGQLIQGLSRATRYNRFHGAVNALSEDTLRQMTCVDYRRHLALVITAVVADQERIVADARYVIDARGDGAEFAIVVDDNWQRLGLGERVMQALTAAAESQGLSWIHGGVLRANLPMISLMQRCQFCCTPDREDERLVSVERSLGGMPATHSLTRDRYWPLRWLRSRRRSTHS